MRLKSMVKNMKKEKLPEAVLAQFEAFTTGAEYDGMERDFIALMDELIPKEKHPAIWLRAGSCDGGGKRGKEFALNNADKSFEERIELMKDAGWVTENTDGTYSVERACHCTVIPHKMTNFDFSPTFYGCAAAAELFNLEKALGRKLKLVSYEQSPNSTEERKPCLLRFASQIDN